MYNLRYLTELRNLKEISQDNPITHIGEDDFENPGKKIKIVSLIHQVLEQPAVIVVDPYTLDDWKKGLKKSEELFDVLPELTTVIPENTENLEIYLDIDEDFETENPDFFIFSFKGTSKPHYPDLQKDYNRIVTGDWSIDAALDYVKDYAQIARIAGSLTIPFRKAYYKACRILRRSPRPFKELIYKPSQEDICRDIAVGTGFDHPDDLMSLDQKLTETIEKAVSDGRILALSCYPSEIFFTYHFDVFFDEAATESGAIRDLALEGKYSTVKEAFKEKVKRDSF